MGPAAVRACSSHTHARRSSLHARIAHPPRYANSSRYYLRTLQQLHTYWSDRSALTTCAATNRHGIALAACIHHGWHDASITVDRRNHAAPTDGDAKMKPTIEVVEILSYDATSRTVLVLATDGMAYEVSEDELAEALS